MYCPQCAHHVENDFSFCTNCGRSISLDDDFETIIAAKFVAKNPKAPSSRNALATAIICVTVLAGLCTGAYVYTSHLEYTARQIEIEQKRLEAVAANASAVAEVQRIESERQAKIAADTITAETKRLEKETRENERRERIEANANRMANRAIANAVNGTMNTAWPPMFDSNGRPLRAICNSGSLSYWQYDRALTCLAQGGVRVWYRY